MVDYRFYSNHFSSVCTIAILPDITGEFMKYLPLTLIATLSASLMMALLFVPVIGGIIGKPQVVDAQRQQEMVDLHNGEFDKATGITKLYYQTLSIAIRHPLKVLLSAILLAGGVGFTYNKAGLGAEFFLKWIRLLYGQSSFLW